ncbi:unnamed protein product, partial [marine sediment metagenome]
LKVIQEKIALSLNSAEIILRDINAIGISWSGAVKEGRIVVKDGTIVENFSDKEYQKLISTFNVHIAQELNNKPTYLINDGDAHGFAAMIESKADNLLTLAIGIGLGTSYFDGNKNHTKLLPAGMLGEMGNVVIDISRFATQHLFTSMPGALRMYLSTYGIERLAQRAGVEVDFTGIPQEVRAKSVGEKLISGDPKAQETYAHLGKYLATAVKEISRILNIEHVYITGGAIQGEAGEWVAKQANEILHREYDRTDITVSLVSDRVYNGAIGA